MANEIISYIEMCRREGASLQRGMNFGIGGTHSVILMSLRSNAPYEDRIDADGTVLIYEGHDEPRTIHTKEPKALDQPKLTKNGRLTQNGQFETAAADYKAGKRRPERVRVYEKIHSGIWSYNGMFHLVDGWTEQSGNRSVFKFRLEAVEGEEDLRRPVPLLPERRRIIPAAVKLEVWKRDAGRCVICGANNELHFDHDLPFSLGGTSVTAANVQLLCARHNLSKGVFKSPS
ncbi:MAG: YDG/SRA domain-containing protein [Bryobacteraceae bacterium]